MSEDNGASWPIEEARVIVHVSPDVMDDAEALAAVKADHEKRLREMFRFVTEDAAWSEPEPLWPVESDEGVHLVGRFFAGDLASEPPTLYSLMASQRGVRAG